MGIKDYIELGMTVGGWCMAAGIYIGKIRQHDKILTEIKSDHEKDIAELKAEQKDDRALLLSINNNLTELNTKVGLLLEGRIKSEQEH